MYKNWNLIEFKKMMVIIKVILENLLDKEIMRLDDSRKILMDCSRNKARRTDEYDNIRTDKSIMCQKKHESSRTC